MSSALQHKTDDLKKAIDGKQIRVAVFLDRCIPVNINTWRSDARLLISKFAEVKTIDSTGEESKETRDEVVAVEFQRSLKPLASSIRLSEAFLLDTESRITQPLQQAGMDIIDLNMALGNTIAELKKDDKYVDPDILVMSALHKYTDVVIQVAVARDSVTGLIFCAKAVSVKDSKIIALASVRAKEQQLPGKSRSDEPDAVDVDILLDTMISDLLGKLARHYAANG